MALTKIGKEGITGISNSANANAITIDSGENIALSGTLGVTGVVTANAGVVVDNITIDGNEIDVSSGNFTLDVAGDIILDADGKDYLFKDAGTLIATMSSDNTDFTIRSEVQDRDLKFEGNDGGSVVTALQLDMSAAGIAIFNSQIQAPSGAVSAPTFAFSNDTNTGMSRPTSDALNFVTGGSERMRIDANGHVGIGNTAPANYLDGELVVGNSTKDQYINVVTGTGNAAGLCFQDTTGTSIIGGLRYTHLDNALASWANGAERMRITSAGKVGIGTSSPSQLLDIEFSDNTGGSSGQEIRNTNTGTTANFASLSTNAVNGAVSGLFGSAHYPAWGGANVHMGSATNDPVKIIQNNTVRATIDTSGDVHATNRFTMGTTNTSTGKTGLRVKRVVYNWFSYGANASDNSHIYLHIKTDLVNIVGSNPQPTMSMFHIKGYSYAQDVTDSMVGFHNWTGVFYQAAYRNNGSKTAVSSSYPPYRSSDNRVVLVINVGSSYPGISIDYHQHFEYTYRDVSVTAYSRSASVNGVY